MVGMMMGATGHSWLREDNRPGMDGLVEEVELVLWAVLGTLKVHGGLLLISANSALQPHAATAPPASAHGSLAAVAAVAGPGAAVPSANSALLPHAATATHGGAVAAVGAAEACPGAAPARQQAAYMSSLPWPTSWPAPRGPGAWRGSVGWVGWWSMQGGGLVGLPYSSPSKPHQTLCNETGPSLG